MDEILKFLEEARAVALADPDKSREKALVVTKIEEAAMWREKDLDLKTLHAKTVTV